MSRVPQPPLDQLIDDLYYLEGTPPYSLLKLPPMPSAVLILNLGNPFRIGTSGAPPVQFADGCLLTTGTRHLEFAYPAFTRSVGVHFKPWGWAPFAGIPGSEVCDLQPTVEQVWGRHGDELRDRLDAARTPGRMLALLEQELRRRMMDVPGMRLVRHASARIAAAAGAVSIGGLCEDAGVSTTHLAQRFRQIVGITPKRLARTYRFAKVVLGVDASAATVDWCELAFGAGYFDQSHFVKDFQAFTGCTPTAYLALRRRFLAEHPGHALDVGPLPAD